MSLRQIHIIFELLDGDRTVKALAETGIDKPAVSRGVDRLCELGYVVRRDHPDDRRSVLVSLTPTGRSFAKGAMKD